MTLFIAGVVVGGILGFCICAIISINNSDKDKNIPISDGKKAEENGNAHE